MKSSTIRRSALSKESMNMIENLANDDNYNPQYNMQSDNTPGEYYRESRNPAPAPAAANRSQEIDLLWQTFKSAQFTTNSTFMHVFFGFLMGVVSTLLVMALLGMFVVNTNSDTLKVFEDKNNAPVEDSVEDAKNLAKETDLSNEELAVPAVAEKKAAKETNEEKDKEKLSLKDKIKKEIKDETAKTKDVKETPVATKKYIVKDGDTVEAIIKKNYGSYTPERAEAIMKANNLKNLDHISIDQEILLPIEK